MEEKSPAIDILLATYNGENFLNEQLNSLFQQTFTDFKILVRDDGSTDRTIEIIQKDQQQYPDKIKIIKDEEKNLGATQNFARLLEHASANYIGFCDQDDIWLPNKLEITLKELQKLENANPGKACMVYSDMKLIDEKGNLLNESVWKQLELHPKYFTFNRLLIQNIPHGCTMLFNQAMKKIVSPIPQEAMLHDHWIAIVASALGVSGAIEQPLLKLRNHSSNVTRRETTLQEKAQRFSTNFWSDEAYEKIVEQRVQQAKIFKERFSNQLSPQQIHTIDEFISLGSSKGLRRKWIYLRNGFFRTTWRHTFKMILRGEPVFPLMQ